MYVNPLPGQAGRKLAAGELVDAFQHFENDTIRLPKRSFVKVELTEVMA